MAHTNYRDMPAQIRNLEAFTHGSCHAVSNLDKEYIVVSYSTPIARAKFDGVRWHYRLNARKYSSTTSRLQNIIRLAWAGEKMEEVDGDKELYPEYSFRL